MQGGGHSAGPEVSEGGSPNRPGPLVPWSVWSGTRDALEAVMAWAAESRRCVDGEESPATAIRCVAALGRARAWAYIAANRANGVLMLARTCPDDPGALTLATQRVRALRVRAEPPPRPPACYRVDPTGPAEVVLVGRTVTLARDEARALYALADGAASALATIIPPMYDARTTDRPDGPAE